MHWPPLATLALAIVIELLLPSRLTLGPRWLLPGLETLMLLGLLVASPYRIEERNPVRRRIAVSLAALVSLANAVSLGLLCHLLLHHTVTNGDQLIESGMLIWLTNVLIFSLWYWELDRGGPGRRAVAEDGTPDFLYPQMTMEDDFVDQQWRPVFLDYLYVSLTNATAFSPTDTMPLSVSAKTVMGIQSVISLVTIGLVISRAVNIL